MKRLSFENVRCKKDVLDFIIDHPDKIWVSDDILKQNLDSLATLPEELDNRFLGFVNYVDEFYSSYGYYDFLNQKISTILAGASYYKHYYDQISELSDGELSILAKFSFVAPVDVYSKYLSVFSKDILSTIQSKTDDFMLYDDLMSYVSLSVEDGCPMNMISSNLKNMSLQTLMEQERFLDQKKMSEFDHTFNV